MAEIDDDPPVKTSVTKLKAVIAGPDTIKTAKGNIVTKADWLKAKDNGLPFATHEDYAKYVDGWATPPGSDQPKVNKVVNQNKPIIDSSDKAKGLASNYYSSNQVAKSPTPASIKSNRY